MRIVSITKRHLQVVRIQKLVRRHLSLKRAQEKMDSIVIIQVCSAVGFFVTVCQLDIFVV